ncbi:MAG TPA: VOC family protein [Terriglobales bacterium]|nr:VOC family protein [Terriglobales bacterium]
MRPPGTMWNLPWNSANFSIPTTVRVLVHDIHSVSPWYVDKLGLRKLSENPWGEADVETYKFKEGGNSVVLTTKKSFATGKTPILFTKKISRMKDVLAARGVEPGPIEQDRQGIRYFQIHDPEGNVIEVVEAR